MNEGDGGEFLDQDFEPDEYVFDPKTGKVVKKTKDEDGDLDAALEAAMKELDEKPKGGLKKFRDKDD